eukprot:CAMPEP_0171515262 /NCGR_PEP_ID=MMETSP0959-20130129/3348_1 /TAXON_ID=87120 /ORGANISM="Aurantiochytrium limacinum, Strain ATCCMYA-1381" /LENGTH=326 /DNA_ID=CAMNT_0012053771 /DNA_START=37 /DNA_END=1014 /DNA_ORIENTATION=-
MQLSSWSLVVFALLGNLLQICSVLAEEVVDSCTDISDGDGDSSCEFVLQTKELWNGVTIPRVGFGTAGMRGAETERVVRYALEAGFRHFDGAEATEWYDDAALGRALTKYLNETPSVSREDLFLTTKVHPKNLGRTRTHAAIENMLVRLQTSYLDLVLLHYPVCGSWIPACQGVDPEGDWLEAYSVLEEYYDKGTIRAIGLSNVGRYEIARCMSEARVTPHVVQNWMDPFHQDADVRAECEQHRIAYTSYSTLGTQWQYREPYKRNLVFENEALLAIAKRTSRSVQETVLLWALQRDAIILPRSTSKNHIEANAKLLHLQPSDLLT